MRPLLPALLLVGACTLPDDDLDADGWSQAQGDCNDLDPAVNPDAFDEPGDTVDQDCDGLLATLWVRGVDHSCALHDSGSVECTGGNSHGQLDVPSHDAHYVEIAAGAYHTCAMDAAGLVDCWGDDSFGQSTPPDLTFVGIGAGDWHSLGYQDSGLAVCWGKCLAVPR